MTMPGIPPGQAPVPPTLPGVMGGLRRGIAEANRRGPLGGATFAFSQYTAPSGGGITAGWQRLNVFSLAAGAGAGLTVTGANTWVPATGVWTIKGLLVLGNGGNNLSTAVQFALTDGAATPGNIYGIGSGACVSKTVAASFATDMYCGGGQLQLWANPTYSAVVNQLVVTFRRIT